MTGRALRSPLAVAAIAACAAASSPAPAASVLQYHADLAPAGAYVAAAPTRAAVATLHRDPTFAATTEGAAYAQPLYVEDQAGRDVILVATEENRVYALDATTGAAIWARQLAVPVPG